MSERVVSDLNGAATLSTSEEPTSRLVAAARAYMAQPTDEHRRQLVAAAADLLEHAVLAGEQGAVDVTGSAEGDRLALVVQDHGGGMPARDADRVFERFYQVDKARADNRGRGLGLAIAREIVQAHGGRIGLESSPAGGTSFTVRIPVLETSASTPLLSTEPARPAEVGATHR